MKQPNPTAKQASAPMDAFFTRKQATEGVKLPLSKPDGTPTEHWLRIRGVDSDEFKIADSEARRSAMQLAASGDATKLPEQFLIGRLELIASLVIAWSFPQPCTKEEVVKFLREAPQIADEVDLLASRRRLFFGKSSQNSTPTPVPSSS